jgi:hypothetical protein
VQLPHRIIYHPDFDIDANRLGGIAAVQRVISPLIAALEQNPFIFGLLDVNSGIRWAALRAAEGMPRLLVTFIVDEDDDVIMQSVVSRDARPF